MVTFALAFGAIAPTCRMMCGQALHIKQNDYVLAGKAMGMGNIRMMVKQIFPNAFAPLLVGMTMRDLGIKIFTFVFGRARRNGYAALVSMARLHPEFYGLPPDPELTARRSVAEIVHELGHVVGLDHCEDFGCIMHFANNAETIDLRGETFCPTCSSELPKDFLSM